jgi:hypothetical protein
MYWRRGGHHSQCTLDHMNEVFKLCSVVIIPLSLRQGEVLSEAAPTEHRIVNETARAIRHALSDLNWLFLASHQRFAVYLTFLKPAERSPPS